MNVGRASCVGGDGGKGGRWRTKASLGTLGMVDGTYRRMVGHVVGAVEYDELASIMRRRDAILILRVASTSGVWSCPDSAAEMPAAKMRSCSEMMRS